MNERNGNASSKTEMRAADEIFMYADGKVNEKTFLWSMAGYQPNPYSFGNHGLILNSTFFQVAPE